MPQLDQCRYAPEDAFSGMFQSFKTGQPTWQTIAGMTITTLETFGLLLDAWAVAIAANDPERIGSFAEPDWVLVGPEGGPVPRDRFLALVAAGDLVHTEMSFRILDARVHGDVAVVLAHGTNRGTWQGRPFDADEWVTDVFVRRDDGWRCTMSALTPNHAATTS